jgi:hypothetical protein
MVGPISIRRADERDRAAIWQIVEPVIREGCTYSLPSDMSEEEGLRYWFEPTHEVFVAESDCEVAGTYFMRPITPEADRMLPTAAT